MKRRAAVRPTIARAPEPPPRFRPAWATEQVRTAHASSYRTQTLIEHVMAGGYRLPNFQRPWAWTDADIVVLLDSLFSCAYVGTLLVWERCGLDPSVERFGEVDIISPAGRAGLVIDGQQRLSALVTAMRCGRFFFDLRAGSFVVGVAGPWLCPAPAVLSQDWLFDEEERAWSEAHAAKHGLAEREVRGSWMAAFSAMGRSEVHVCVLNYRWDLDAVVKNYKLLNSTGVKMSAEDLDAGLMRAEAVR